MRLFKPNINRMQVRGDFKGLIRALTDRDAEVCRAATEALYRFGENAIVPLINALIDGDPRVRAAAADVLCALGPKAVEEVLKAMKHQHPYFRRAAATLLSRFEFKGGMAAITALKEALRDPDMGVRQAAAEGLGKLRLPSAIEPLIAAIRDMEGQTSIKMLSSLRDKIEVDRRRMDGVTSPQEMHLQLQEAIAGVTQLREEIDRIDQERQPFLKALEELFISTCLGPYLSKDIISATKDRCFLIRQVAASTLGQIGGEQAVELLTTLLDDQSAAVRDAATEALHKCNSPKPR